MARGVISIQSNVRKGFTIFGKYITQHGIPQRIQERRLKVKNSDNFVKQIP